MTVSLLTIEQVGENGYINQRLAQPLQNRRRGAWNWRAGRAGFALFGRFKPITNDLFGAVLVPINAHTPPAALSLGQRPQPSGQRRAGQRQDRMGFAG